MMFSDYLNTVQFRGKIVSKQPVSDVTSILDESCILVSPSHSSVLKQAGESDLAIIRFLVVLKEIIPSAPYLFTYLWGEMNRFALVDCYQVAFTNDDYTTPYFFVSCQARNDTGQPGSYSPGSLYKPEGFIYGDLAITIPPERIGALVGSTRIYWPGSVRLAVAAFAAPPDVNTALRSSPFLYENKQSRFLHDNAQFVATFDWDFDSFALWSPDLDAAFDLIYRALKDTHPAPRFIR